ncbi:MAG: DUF1640 domain-containing protein [Gammaproteobacteria bacterium]|nr:DUF1640 domain-containing protein [Gammaproteobacteria bacterium]
MSSVPFDTHAAVKRLTEAGVTEAQAEALIRAITESNARADLVTKADLRDAISALEIRLIKFMVVQTIAIIGLTVTLIQLLG